MMMMMMMNDNDDDSNKLSQNRMKLTKRGNPPRFVNS